MEDTSERDSDQVVYRQTRPKPRSGPDGGRGVGDLKRDVELPGKSKMIMVDQLWLVVWIDEDEVEDQAEKRPTGGEKQGAPSGESREASWEVKSSGIVTSFPHTSYRRAEQSDGKTNGINNPFHTADVREAVLRRLEKREELSIDAAQMASIIVSEAVLGTLKIADDLTLNFLELFREAINNSTIRYDQFFRTFNRGMSMKGGGIDGRKQEQRRDELKLAIDVGDIIDELNSLKQLFDIQIKVLRGARDDLQNVSSMRSLRDGLSKLSNELETDYLGQIKVMIEDSERLRKSLMTLLDLQQKEHSISEAQSANQQALFNAKQALSAQEQADATEAQSQILFVFTVVTVVFLPPSFFATYFGVVEYDRSYVLGVLWGVSVPVVLIFLVGSGVWFRLGSKRTAKERIAELKRLEEKGYLPPGLIDEDSDERKKMDALPNESEKLRLRSFWTRETISVDTESAENRH
jgi:hypothetical protein